MARKGILIHTFSEELRNDIAGACLGDDKEV